MQRSRSTRSRRVLAALRAAAPLAAMFLLTGNAVISCSGDDPNSDSGGGGGGGGGSTRPNSAAMGRWTPVTDVDTCTKDFHDTYAVIGPDGKRYPTWHPPSAVDPATSRSCTFGHEHGRDPRGSALWTTLRDHYAWDANGNGTIDTAEREASGVPFGYAAEQQRAWNSANGVANGNRDEDHVSYKIAWENGITRTRTVNGVAQTFDLSCDVLTMLHQESHSGESFASNLHEVIHAIDCSRGSDAARFGGKLIVSALATFGNPGEFAVRSGDTTSVVRFGTPQPANSIAGGTELGRVIPAAERVHALVLVPANQTSDFASALDERWETVLRLTRSDGTEVVYLDPWYSVASPSRYFDVTRLGAIARTVELCYIGYSLSGELIDDPLRAPLIVRQARGPECSSLAPNGPATPRITRIAFDDPRSTFNGCRRHVSLGAARIANAGGATLVYTDPYGRSARSATFAGAVKQYVGTLNTAGDPDRVAFGADVDPCLTGSGIHAPN